MRIGIFAMLVWLGVGTLCAQTPTTVVQAPDIVQPVTAGTTLSISTPTGGVYLYKGENSITLKQGFLASARTNNASGVNTYTGSNFFLAYLVVPTVYAELKMKLDDSYYTTVDGKLNFRYEEEYYADPSTAAGKLKYQIYDYMRRPVVPSSLLTTAILPNANRVLGSNFYSIDMATSGFTNLVATNELDSYYTL